MQVETLRDVLVWTREFHKNLAACLQHCAGKNENARSQMLLAYLARHEKELTETVDGFVDTAETRALNTWCYDYMDKHPILHSVHCDAPFQDLEPDEIMSVVSNQHDQVIELYRYLYGRADIEETRELMEELKSLEEQQIKQMVQGVNRMRDM
ncbi:ATPase [Microbulbifer harenosus]|uniref:ATPase n=1 Tax=Microbulbifer harenosus TaxID=2576840 RepID=A0ABY2UIN7_9GAMM|nr:MULTISPECIES: ATPase [Microbulbifer]QIL89077.1 ATPase [Microbulbifer sp. SH-1]TLM77811.1 ATPase [Microbulbifer harenosus]